MSDATPHTLLRELLGPLCMPKQLSLRECSIRLIELKALLCTWSGSTRQVSTGLPGLAIGATLLSSKRGLRLSCIQLTALDMEWRRCMARQYKVSDPHMLIYKYGDRWILELHYYETRQLTLGHALVLGDYDTWDEAIGVCSFKQQGALEELLDDYWR
jgi:hypothetical protein